MNQGFKLRFDQLRDNDPTSSADQSDPLLAEQYPTQGHTRNICLVWPDGRRAFLNYAYLTEGEYDPSDQISLIKLNFTSHIVTMNGYCLESLFMALIDHLPRIIRVTDLRYSLRTNDAHIPTVISITLTAVDE